MLPKMNRNISLQNPMPVGAQSHSNYNSLMTNGISEVSPLKLFSRAKGAINSIYQQSYLFIGEVNEFLDCKPLILNLLLN